MTTPKITPFLFEGEITVRVVDRDGVPWFVATDVCRALGLANAAEAVRGLDDDEKGISSPDTLGGHQHVIVVSESGLYAMIFHSRKPEASRFRKWVTAEVLPSLRIKGKYEIMPPDFPSGKPEAWKLPLVTETRRSFGTWAAREMWLTLGLPVVPSMRFIPQQQDMFMTWPPQGGSALSVP